MTQTRIYIVALKNNDAPGHVRSKRLVRASHPVKALHHVAADYSVAVASQDELVRLVGEGVKVEEAKGVDQEELPV